MMPPADFTWLYFGVLAKAQLEVDGGKQMCTYTEMDKTWLHHNREADRSDNKAVTNYVICLK